MAATRLEGLTAVVTGSSSGIGRGIALALAAAGARLVVCADLKEGHVALSTSAATVKTSLSHGAEMVSRALVTSKDNNDESVDTPTHELIHARYGKERAIFVRCDISREKSDAADGIFSIENAIQEAVSRTGRLDVSVSVSVLFRATSANQIQRLVNNAGAGILDIPLHEMTAAQWNQCFGVDSAGTFIATKFAVTQFLQQDEDEYGFRGNIINVSSIAGSAGLPGCSAYCAAKSAIIGFTRSVAIEYAERRIRCNAIKPGYIMTPLLHKIIETTDDVTWLEKASPFNRLGQPKDIGQAAVWLASGRESGYVTGIDLSVDGGFLAR
ncbi:uncharacterized protein TRUGW13939_00377 [Talaromyces rugulosus]|uniref:Uncharacterized protein n=1 Tax=Talaromyces rugulosus TaxID=121627 RepID=A0A7H8QH61_TALRU|nr:uncharacterized protein TRUGW13939_00377 [Talaromyces rugulosus]QKX53299.1 hypothetical protein TRUGW13939_00377 [Talaromyces rugulosus]